MATWASVLDLEERYETALPDRADIVLDDAETLLKRKVSGIQDRIDADPQTLDPALVKYVLCSAVLRYLRNPRGYGWERDGDYSYGFPIGQPTVGNLGLFFTQDELDLLTSPADGWSPVGTINLGTPYALDDRTQRWPSVPPDIWSDNPLRGQGSVIEDVDTDDGEALVP